MSTLFAKAAAYRKNHPSVTQAKAVQIVAKEQRSAPKKKAAKKATVKVKKTAAHRKKAAVGKAKRPGGDSRKIKLKVRKNQGEITISGIAGVSLAKTKTELLHQQALQKALATHMALKKTPGTTATEKARLQRDINYYKAAIAASKKHVTALKKGI